MKVMHPLSAILVASLFLVSACSKPAPGITATADAPAATATGSVPAGSQVAAAVSNKPWYTDPLEKLGFYVFPAPETIPPVVVKTLEGASTSVASVAGKVVLLNFWATWCPPCRTEMPSIQILNDKLKGSAFAVFAISVAEKPATVTEFLKTNPYSFPMYLDESGSASAPFAGQGIPTTFILDKQGRALAGMVGARSYDGPEVVSLLKELSERLQ
jgi:thiol-disulfide isomerase/thioredoxin